MTRTTNDADDRRVRVGVVGMGKQGQLLVERLERRRDTELVAVVDADPAKVGKRLADVIGSETARDLTIAESLDTLRGVDVALVATTSRMRSVAPVLETIASLGVNAITICEEAVYPWRQFPAESARLDEVARANGVSILGCGGNPGFLMDVLPIVFSFGVERVEKVTMRRSLDMRPHRPERLTRFALGLTPEQFDTVDPATLTGHVGFTQSMYCLADAFGWELDETREERVRPAVIATAPREGDHFTVPAGTVAVIEHRAWARRGDDKLIDIAMYFGFHDSQDTIGHADVYEIRATDHTLSVRMEPSWGPFATTPSTMINLVSAVYSGEPGLLSVVDFSVRQLAARGAEVSASGGLSDYNHLSSLAGGVT